VVGICVDNYAVRHRKVESGISAWSRDMAILLRKPGKTGGKRLYVIGYGEYLEYI
jgi:hypothetical protein